MAIATPGRIYINVQRNRAVWRFTSAQLPEWNENQFEAVDVTGNEPNIGDVWDGNAFSPYVPTPEEQAAADLAAANLAARQAARADALIAFLIEKTPAEVAARINSDITDLASARQVIAKIAVAVSVLAKQGLR